jgi:hypothetical protein
VGPIDHTEEEQRLRPRARAVVPQVRTVLQVKLPAHLLRYAMMSRNRSAFDISASASAELKSHFAMAKRSSMMAAALCDWAHAISDVSPPQIRTIKQTSRVRTY